MFLILRTTPNIFFSILLLGCGIPGGEPRAPNLSAGPVNQLEIAGNACGPAALLTSVKCGGERWQKLAERLPGETDRSKMLYIIRAHGLKPSTSLRNRKRWTNDGVNMEDLSVIAGELSTLEGLPAPAMAGFLDGSTKKPEKTLRRLHSHLRKSLRRGFPPILSVRRHVLRNGRWPALRGHFVTVVAVSERVPHGATSFQITCFDPWKGRSLTGMVRIAADTNTARVPSHLEIEMPGIRVGSSELKAGEHSHLVPAMALGLW